MNRLQEELLSILEIYIDICRELNLTYYLANGSALGAEKYSGFIPWDDDIDIVMPRADYEIFCEKAPDFLPKHLFLQNYQTDIRFPLFYSKLRNSNTTFIENDVKNLPINHGIYIDVFPLDGYPDNKISQVILKYRLKILSCKQFCGFDNDKRPHKVLARFLGYHRRTNKTLAAMERLVRRFGDHTKNICDYGDRQQKGCLPREFYGEGKEAIFEHLQVRIPQRIDEYLTYKYDNWKADLPADQQKSHHNTVAFDLDKPYLDYLRNL